MKLSVHGAGREVGRSCLGIQSKNSHFLFDCGIKITKEATEYPLNLPVRDIDAVFLTHAHLDHSGALPYFNYFGLECPIFTTGMTKQICKLLLKDSLHVELLRGLRPFHSLDNVKNALCLMELIPYKRTIQWNGLEFTFFDAGHIPGSASIQVNVDGVSILYTGDIKVLDSLLLTGAKDFPHVDILILESTYGDRCQKSRESEEKNFLKKCEETIAHGGKVIVPAFAIGRTQEVLMLLMRLPPSIPLFLDGMGKKALYYFLKEEGWIKNKPLLLQVERRVQFVKSKKRRQEVTRIPGVFVSSAGMLDGGPILDYVRELYTDPKTAILMTGFQTEHSNGRMLLNAHNIQLESGVVAVKNSIEKFEFSAHADIEELHHIISRIMPKKLYLVHGDEAAIDALQMWSKEQGIDTYALKSGEEMEF